MSLACSAYLVRDYDEAINWFRRTIGWQLVEDTELGGGKRRVRIAAPVGGKLLRARASTSEQIAAIGKTAGGRVAVFFDLYGNRWDLIGPAIKPTENSGETR